MKKRLALFLITALVLIMVPAAASADSDGSNPPAINCSTDTVYKGIPVDITVKPNSIMYYNQTNSIKLYVYKGKVSISDFKEGNLDKPLKTYSGTYTDVSQKKTFSYSPSITGSITLIAAQYVNDQYSQASSQYLTVKSSSSLETFSVMSPYGFTKSIKGTSMNVGFYYYKYYEGVTNKVKVTIKRGSKVLKTKEYKLTSGSQDKSFKYTPAKTGTYKFIFTGYINGAKCKSTTCEVKVISQSGIKSLTPSISYLYYDRAKTPKSVEVGLKGINGASKIKIYRAKTKSGKYTLVKTSSLNGSFYSTAKYSSTYPYYKIRLTSGKYTSEYSSAVKITPIGKVKNVKVSEDTETGYYGGNKYQYMKVTWSKLSGATGYQLFYKKDGKMKWLGSSIGSDTSCIIYPNKLYEIGTSAYVYVQPIYMTSNVYSYGYYSDGKKLTVKVLN